METFLLPDFAHNQLITESKVSVADFDDNLKLVITDFNKKYNTYAKLKKEEFLPSLHALSAVIMQNIYDYYVDKGDQEVSLGANPTKTEIKKAAKDIKDEIADPTPDPAPAPKPANPAAPKPIVTRKPKDPAPTPDPAPAPAPIPQDPEPTNKNEKALFLLIKGGITENITKAMLKENGFDTGAWGPLGITGCRVGKYTLSKGFSDTTYKLK